MSRPQPIRVFLVDDQELVRAGFEMLLSATPDLLVVGSAGDGQAALDALRRPEHRADVVLMDIRLPGIDGVETTRQLLATADPPRVVMLTTFDSDDLLVAALRAGACGYLVKDAGPTELLAAIRAAAAGESPVSPRLVRRLIDSFVLVTPAMPSEDRPAVAPSTLARLTAREREILAAIGLGLTNAEIAVRLHVAESTVKTHVGSVLRKLELRDRVQAVILAQTLESADGSPAPG
ncbi:DNA-binding response regulator [Actinoplanes philippinensis]|uniref:DNA-binding response regulator, NarL/FixJ family, contains REC and HTH domains n=1 Tax=Actinoplanes philippinensis TaxID=35752 RepID=A0A1I2G2B9_9ACTN|nr:response regulator transcription factor [Actinoplanes philippinensis]GIE76505.1 DNA-binding response regulator [Actinoplanes philippinensis]SFF11100.1 DNA-binding response regulator, NarL/FixJ family, contains REC and HTH domains [Actinoplanes philippinensis]